MKIIKKLDKLFDKYYSKQLEIQDAENPEYYLYMGKANGIKESIDLIEKDKKNIKKLLQFKANEYKLKRDFAKKKCDNQNKFDISFEAEVEDEMLLLAEREYSVVLDILNYISK